MLVLGFDNISKKSGKYSFENNFNSKISKLIKNVDLSQMVFCRNYCRVNLENGISVKELVVEVKVVVNSLVVEEVVTVSEVSEVVVVVDVLE